MVHILVLKERIERGKIRSIELNVSRYWNLLLARQLTQNVGGVDRFALREERP